MSKVKIMCVHTGKLVMEVGTRHGGITTCNKNLLFTPYTAKQILCFYMIIYNANGYNARSSRFVCKKLI